MKMFIKEVKKKKIEGIAVYENERCMNRNSFSDTNFNIKVHESSYVIFSFSFHFIHFPVMRTLFLTTMLRI